MQRSNLKTKTNFWETICFEPKILLMKRNGLIICSNAGEVRLLVIEFVFLLFKGEISVGNHRVTRQKWRKEDKILAP